MSILEFWIIVEIFEGEQRVSQQVVNCLFKQFQELISYTNLDFLTSKTQITNTESRNVRSQVHWLGNFI